MKVLLLGSGAREHAIAWKLSQSKQLTDLYGWPGNPAIQRLAKSVDLPPSASAEQLGRFSLDRGIDLVVCGPEIPLSQGFADILEGMGIRVFGPKKIAAQLESSKEFAKSIMKEAGVPTASYDLVTSREECARVAREYIRNKGAAILKASGLAGGKGVFICHNEDQIEPALEHLYGTSMKEASKSLVIEEELIGREVSYFTFLSPDESTPLGFAVDFKRINNGDQGPNTGGMGCYTPVPWLPEDAGQKVEELVVTPMLKTLRAKNIPYCGWLYVGLMWTEQGPKVIEFNVRLGDPEAQVLAVADQRDWLEVIAAKTGLSDKKFSFQGTVEKKAVGVVMTSPGYPFGKDEPAPIDLDDRFFSMGAKAFAFGASLQNRNGSIGPGTGRVLTVIGQGETFAACRSDVYDKVKEISEVWGQCHYRTDIAELVSSEESNV